MNLRFSGREKAIGDIDGDALLTLRREPVDQQRKVDVLPLRPDALRIRLQRRQLILEDHLGIIQQPTDQRGLAIVDAAAGDEPQQALVLVLIEISGDVLGDEGIGLVDFTGFDQIGVGHQK